MDELQSLRHLLVASVPPDTTVAWQAGAALSARDFRNRAGAWAKCLAARPGRHCALYQANGFEFLCALFGAWRAGKTVWLPGDTLPVTVDGLASAVSEFLGDFPGMACLGFPDSSTEVPAAELPAPDPALMLYTSGTTGVPAAIPKTIAQLDAEIHALHALWGDAVGSASVLASVPHQHFYGLLFKLLWPLARGAALTSESLHYAEEVTARLASVPGVWVASPALLKRLPEGIDWVKAGRNLRAVFSSGGPLPLDAAERVARLLGRGVIEVYGSTETGGVAHRIQTGPGTRWRALPGVTVTQDARSGRLVVSSPWLGDRAVGMTEDQGEVFPDGRFTLLGRADRIAKVEEKRVSLTALERVLRHTPWVRDGRLIQLSGGRLGAVVVPSEEGWQALARHGRRNLVGQLRKALAAHAERAVVPRRWRFVSALPENGLGKVANAALLSRFEPQSSAAMLLVREETTEPGRVALRLSVSPDLAWFDGHFPDAPILPGVVQVHWVVALGRERFDLPGKFLRLEQLKFQRVITPGMEVLLVLEHLADRNAVSFRYSSARGTHGSGRVVFRD